MRFSNSLQALRRFIPRGRFGRSVAVLAGGTASGQAIVALASPIITRLYTPEDLGFLAVFSSILAMVSVLAALRYELAIPLPQDDADAAALVALSLGVIVAVSLLIGVGVQLLGGYVADWAKSPALRQHLWLLPVGVGLVGLYQVLSYWAVRRQAFGRIARTKFYQGLGASSTQILLGLAAVGPAGLLLGQVVGQGAGGTTLAVEAWREGREHLRTMSPEALRRVAWRYRRFPQLSSFSGLLNSAGLQLPALLLASFYGPLVAGWFLLGQRVVGIPMALLGQAVAQVYLGTASRLVQEDRARLRLVFAKTAGRLLVLGVIPMGILGVAGPWLFSRVFGIEWVEAGLYVQLLAGAFLLQFVVTPLSQTLNITERQDLQLAWDLGRLVLVLGALLGTWQLGGSAWHAVAAYAGAICLAYAVLFLLNLWALASHMRKREPEASR